MSTARRARASRIAATGGSWRVLAVAMSLMLVGGVLILSAGLGLITRVIDDGGTPMSFWIASPQVRAGWIAAGRQLESEPTIGAAPLPEPVPGIIVAHGMAGSQRLMLGYAQGLAYAGYAVMLVDLAGHGGNNAVFGDDAVLQDIDRAYAQLVRQPEVDPDRVALLGYSMGGRAVMRAAIAAPERYPATVAVSALAADVTADAPRNLQLQAGAWEGSSVAAAQRLLQAAGGESSDFDAGRARQLIVVPAADHMGILFRDASRGAARDWFDLSLRPDIALREPYLDLRVIGWLLFVAGSLLLLLSLEPAFAQPSGALVRPRHAIATLGAPFAAAALGAMLFRVVDPSRVLGMPIAGTLAAWFGLAGLLVIAAGVRLRRPRARQLLWAGGLFVFLWLAVGLSAELVWLQWTLIPARLWRWPLLAVACAPWFIAAAACQQHDTRPAWAWWLLNSVTLVAGALLLGAVLPDLGLLRLIVPLLPLFLGITAVTATRTNDPWAAGIGNALFFGWLLASAFPLL